MQKPLVESIWPEPPNRLYYRRTDGKHRAVSPVPREDAEAIYVNWAVVLERLGEIDMPNEVYWNIRKAISEIK